MIMRSGFSLALLLVFMSIASTVVFGAVAVTISNSQASSKYDLGVESYVIAESGIENGLLRLLRDPGYAGEVLAVGPGTATIVVTGSGPYTITSTGLVYDFSHTLQATATYINGILTLDSWTEIYP